MQISLLSFIVQLLPLLTRGQICQPLPCTLQQLVSVLQARMQVLWQDRPPWLQYPPKIRIQELEMGCSRGLIGIVQAQLLMGDSQEQCLLARSQTRICLLADTPSLPPNMQSLPLWTHIDEPIISPSLYNNIYDLLPRMWQVYRLGLPLPPNMNSWSPQAQPACPTRGYRISPSTRTVVKVRSSSKIYFLGLCWGDSPPIRQMLGPRVRVTERAGATNQRNQVRRRVGVGVGDSGSSRMYSQRVLLPQTNLARLWYSVGSSFFLELLLLALRLGRFASTSVWITLANASQLLLSAIQLNTIVGIILLGCDKSQCWGYSSDDTLLFSQICYN